VEILSDLVAIDFGLYHLSTRTLIFSDLHLGYEEELRRNGILVPKTQLADMLRRIQRIINELPSLPATIVLNGDIKHSFGRVYRQEVEDFTAILGKFRSVAPKADIVAVEGNHDPLLDILLRQHNLVARPEYKIGNVLIIHGDKIPEDLQGIQTIIIGHDHPAVLLRNKSKSEKYKCHLVGRYEKYAVVVQPSAQPLLHGTDVLTEPLLSPLLKRILRHRVFAIEESTGDILAFGTIAFLRQRLHL